MRLRLGRSRQSRRIGFVADLSSFRASLDGFVGGREAIAARGEFESVQPLQDWALVHFWTWEELNRSVLLARR